MVSTSECHHRGTHQHPELGVGQLCLAAPGTLEQSTETQRGAFSTAPHAVCYTQAEKLEQQRFAMLRCQSPQEVLWSTESGREPGLWMKRKGHSIGGSFQRKAGVPSLQGSLILCIPSSPAFDLRCRFAFFLRPSFVCLLCCFLFARALDCLSCFQG